MSGVYGLDAPLGDGEGFETGFFGVEFADGPGVDCGGAEVAFDGGGDYEGEGDVWVLDGEGLVEEEGEGFGGGVEGAGGCWDYGCEGG